MRRDWTRGVAARRFCPKSRGLGVERKRREEENRGKDNHTRADLDGHPRPQRKIAEKSPN